MGTPVKPYKGREESKKEQVREMFDQIAPSYDLLNRMLSLGIDVLWRKKAIRMLKPLKPQVIADIATGTGDFAVEAMALKPKQVIAINISSEMISIGREKVAKKGLDRQIEFRIGDSEGLDLPTGSIDAVTVGFGVRNFENLPKGLAEICRVLRPGGVAVILEPAFPTKFPLGPLFQFYFKVIAPRIGKMVSGDDAAYTYLPESVAAFPHGEDFLAICKKAGFSRSQFRPLTGGICALYWLEK